MLDDVMGGVMKAGIPVSLLLFPFPPPALSLPPRLNYRRLISGQYVVLGRRVDGWTAEVRD